jgi:hypothetical protein
MQLYKIRKPEKTVNPGQNEGRLTCPAGLAILGTKALVPDVEKRERIGQVAT